MIRGAIVDLHTLLDSRESGGSCEQGMPHGAKVDRIRSYGRSGDDSWRLSEYASRLGEAGKIPMHRNPANAYRLFRRSDLDKFLKQVARPAKPK